MTARGVRDSVYVYVRVSHPLTLRTRGERAEKETPQKTAHHRHSSVRHTLLRPSHPPLRRTPLHSGRGVREKAFRAAISNIININTSSASRARAL